MLLDSGNSDHVNARYDLLVAEPISTLVTQGNTTTITDTASNKRITSDDDPLTLLQRALEQHFSGNITPANLPFYAGAMGHFGYDLGRRFETLPVAAESPYITPDMAVGIYRWAIIKERSNGHIYLTGYSQQDLAQAREWETLAANLVARKTAFRLTRPWQANMNEAQYSQKFNQVQDYLRAGDCYQVNLAQRFDASYEGDEWQAFLALRRANNAPFSAFIRLPESAILSVSPERFLQVDNGRVETKPIKGTRPNHHDAHKDAQEIAQLQASEKDRAENLMIVDLLRNDLSKHCKPGSVKVPSLFAIETFPAVHHLVSTVTGELADNSHPLDLLRGAFPGGSITGAPKIRAMQVIEELEPQRRNIYCGSIGYVSYHGHMDTSITIRTLLCEQGKIYCWAGGGLVLDSAADSEYQETYHKVNKILPVLEGMGG